MAGYLLDRLHIFYILPVLSHEYKDIALNFKQNSENFARLNQKVQLINDGRTDLLSQGQGKVVKVSQCAWAEEEMDRGAEGTSCIGVISLFYHVSLEHMGLHGMCFHHINTRNRCSDVSPRGEICQVCCKALQSLTFKGPTLGSL